MVVGRTIAFAVDDMYAAAAVFYAVMQKMQQLPFCLIAVQSVQVDFRIQAKLSFAQFFSAHYAVVPELYNSASLQVPLFQHQIQPHRLSVPPR